MRTMLLIPLFSAALVAACSSSKGTNANPSPDGGPPLVDGGGTADAPPDPTANCPAGFADCKGNGSCDVNIASDGANCGGCGHSCAGGACANGVCPSVVLASAQDYARDIVVDATNVYWTDAQAGAVRKVPIGGGATADLVTGQNLPFGLAVDAKSVYWTTQGTDPVAYIDATVMSVPLGGGTAATLASNQAQSEHMAMSGSNLFWVNQGKFPDLTNGSIMKSALDGSGAIALVGGLTNANFVAVDAQYAYFTTAGTPPNNDGTVQRVSIAGGAPKVIASNQAASWGIAVDDKNVYWTNSVKDATVMMAPKDGSGAPVTLASGQARANGIFVDADFVYWTNLDGGTVMRVAKTGGKPTTLATGLAWPESVVTDATSVYFTCRGTDNHDGSVVKVPK